MGGFSNAHLQNRSGLRARNRRAELQEEEEVFGETNLPARRYTRIRDFKSALTFVDGSLSDFAGVLRRKPECGRIFLSYLILLHLWVLFVLYHFGRSHAFKNQVLDNDNH
jgi:hypothetical protein